MKRREFIAGLGAAASVSWPLAAKAQSRPAVVGFIDPRSPEGMADRLRAFRQGLKEGGYVEGENLAIEYRWAENQMDRLPEAVRRACFPASRSDPDARRGHLNAGREVGDDGGPDRFHCRGGSCAARARQKPVAAGRKSDRRQLPQHRVDRQAARICCGRCCRRPIGSPCSSIRRMPATPKPH